MKTILVKILYSLLYLLSFSGILLAETGKMPDTKSVVAGKKLYIKYCQSCHLQKGVGENTIPEHIRKPGYVSAMPLNANSHAWHHGDKQLVGMILDGSRRTKRMPAWKGTISTSEAYNIVAYIKSLWSPWIVSCQGPRHMICMRQKRKRR